MDIFLMRFLKLRPCVKQLWHDKEPFRSNGKDLIFAALYRQIWLLVSIWIKNTFNWNVSQYTINHYWSCIIQMRVLVILVLVGLMMSSVGAQTCKVGCNNSRRICQAGCKGRHMSFAEKRKCSNTCETTFVICEKGCDRNRPTPWKN